MTRLLLALMVLVCLALPANAVPMADGPQIVLVVYGDSRWANTAIDNSDYDNFLPSWYKIRNFAHPGADIPLRGACSSADTTSILGANTDCTFAGTPWACCTGSGTGTCPVCFHLGGRALRQSGTCRYQPDNWRSYTCIEDQTADTASYGEVYWIEYGVNDASAFTDADTAGWDGRVSNAETTYNAVAAVIPTNTPCVMAVTFPSWFDGFASHGVVNSRINDDLRPVIKTAAATAGCAVADMYGAMLNYEASAGTAAMLALYGNCPAKGSTTPFDCIHLDRNAVIDPHPLAVEIQRAVDEALRKKPNRW